MRGAISAGGSIPTTPGGLMHLRVALETGASAFFVARELARLKTSSRSDRSV
jgi:hypothetical protein